jgi:hypothetical protein
MGKDSAALALLMARLMGLGTVTDCAVSIFEGVRFQTEILGSRVASPKRTKHEVRQTRGKDSEVLYNVTDYDPIID